MKKLSKYLGVLMVLCMSFMFTATAATTMQESNFDTKPVNAELVLFVAEVKTEAKKPLTDLEPLSIDERISGSLAVLTGQYKYTVEPFKSYLEFTSQYTSMTAEIYQNPDLRRSILVPWRTIGLS